ncbi:hypothetical protein [Pontibacter sp. G13]|uniref:HD domain-containing protein n=1 Tax=Pontibacter sp. G13 TaxID=3074898 RepID=UPI00288A3BC5|nr:hypothetical protein [Pontibacter sp. G13]WNJ21048.1 hypothetical protein RJD25_11310 [Pontibacter sp. G13]
MLAITEILARNPSPDLRAQLQPDWSNWMGILGNVSDSQSRIFNRICRWHAGWGRHYHDLTHLAHFFSLHQKHQLSWEQPSAFFASVFFHDAVYLPWRKDNEWRSAQLLSRYWEQLAGQRSGLHLAEQIILSTQRHQPLEDHPDIPQFLDLDLAILASDPDRYDEYALAIRKEYWMIPDRVYLPGRQAVLARFLDRPTLYFTAQFQHLWEDRARENLVREIQQLKQKATRP